MGILSAVSGDGGFVRTVLGDVSPLDLGVTYTHEHLYTRPADHLLDGGDRALDDVSKTVEELGLFRRAGGGTIVDVTTLELGRSPEALRRISQLSGVHVVSTTGHVAEDYWRGVVDVDSKSTDDLTEEMVRELCEGMSGTETRAGIIKCGSSLSRVTATEERVLRAAARAQQRTGAPITTHTTAGTAALEQLHILEGAGADLAHVCIGHLDRRLDWETHWSIVQAGANLGYDCMSKDWYEPDARRVEFIRRLVAEGYGHRICVSGDLARRTSLVAWGGGPGYVHIMWRIRPWLLRVGLTEAQVSMLLRDNPGRFLAWT